MPAWISPLIHFPPRGTTRTALALLPPPPRERRHATTAASSSSSYSDCCALVDRCGVAQALSQGRHAHKRTILCDFERATFVANLLIRMYARCASLADAHATFRSLPCRDRNVFSWNFLINGYSRHRRAHDSLRLFHLMLQDARIRPDKFTFANVLAAASSAAAPSAASDCLRAGKIIHAAMLDAGLESDAFVASALVNMYGRCGTLGDARRSFERTSRKDGAVWNAMIAAYSHHGHGMEALRLFFAMQDRGVECGKVSSLNALSACSGVAILACATLVHAHLTSIMGNELEAEVSVSTAIVNMYSECRSLEDARSVFRTMPKRDLVSWSAIICASTAHGEDSEALGLFSEMHKDGLMNPDKVAFISVFGACANLSSLTHGQLIHTNTIELALETDVAVGNALINMYGKCGCHADCHKVFGTMPTHNVISWTALIEVEAYLGCPVAALECAWQMQERGVELNDVSFVNVLSACSHAGLVDEACFYFKSMVEDCDVEATVEHYSSMIDLFGRAGRLEEAELVIRRMSVPPNAIIWESLLSSCRIHGDTGRGRKAAEQAIKMDSRISSPYVLLANIYSSEGRRDDAAKIWRLMFERGLTMCNVHVEV